MGMEKAKVFLLGVIMALGLMFLIGASHGQIGRYQISNEANEPLLVIDTITGDVYRPSQTTLNTTRRPGEWSLRGMIKVYEIKE